VVTTALRLDDLVVAQQSDSQQVVGWKLLGIGPLVATAQIEISRSYVDNSGFELIATIPAAQLFYEDTTVNLYDRWRVVFYKLRLLDVTGAYRDYGPLRVSGELDGPAKSIIRNVRTQLRIGSGNPVLIYQKRFNETQRCTDCWDPVLKQVTRSDCSTCFNTGFEGGFHTPILTLVWIGPESKSNRPTDRLEQPAAVTCLAANFPVLRPRDIIYEIDTGRRYRVGVISTAEKNRMLLSQSFGAEALNPSDIENSLPIPAINSLIPVMSRFRAPRRSMLNEAEASPPVDSIIGDIYI
jgi:hypothetical protein